MATIGELKDTCETLAHELTLFSSRLEAVEKDEDMPHMIDHLERELPYFSPQTEDAIKALIETIRSLVPTLSKE